MKEKRAKKAMGRNTNTIEINGRRYDMSTGAILDVFAPAGVAKNPRPANPATAQTTMSVAKHHPKPNHIAIQTTPSSKPVTRHHDIKRTAPKKLASHQPQHAKTLMRKSVAKPANSFKRGVKAQSSTDSLIRTKATIARKRSIGALDENRVKRAKQIPKSSAVKRFHHPSVPAVYVPPAPAKPLPVQSQQTGNPTRLAWDVSRVAPQPAQTKEQTTADMLERAIQQATSHLEPAPVIRRRRLFWPFSA